jgi:hypothetical protein
VCLQGIIVWELYRKVSILFLSLNPLNETELLQLIIFTDVFKLNTTLSRKTGLLILDGVNRTASHVFIAAGKFESV